MMAGFGDFGVWTDYKIISKKIIMINNYYYNYRILKIN